MKQTVFAVVPLALTLFARPASADEDPSTLNEARDHARRAAELFRDHDHRGALVEYRRAYQILPTFKIQYNIGVVCMELQDWACALAAFERYLADGGRDVPTERVHPLTEDVEKLRRRVGKLRVLVDARGADIAIDDVAVGQSPMTAAVVVNPGPRRVTVTLAPNPPVSKVIEISGGDNRELKFEVTPHPAPEAPAPVPAARDVGTTPGSPAPPEPIEPPSKTPFLVALSITGALAVGGAVTGFLALDAKSRLHDTVGRFGVTPNEVKSVRDEASTFALATDILLSSTLVAAGVTTYLLFRRRSEPTVSAGLGPRGASLVGRF